MEHVGRGLDTSDAVYQQQRGGFVFGLGMLVLMLAWRVREDAVLHVRMQIEKWLTAATL